MHASRDDPVPCLAALLPRSIETRHRSRRFETADVPQADVRRRIAPTEAESGTLIFEQLSPQIVWCVATAILASACFAQPIRWLRAGAIIAGLSSLLYAVLTDAKALAATQVLLIAVNAWRLFERWRLRGRISAARTEVIDPRDFEEYFRRERHSHGDTLFLKGNPGHYAYYVASGEVSIPEVGAVVGPGDFFGEFSLFTDGGLRTAGAVCRTDVELYRIDSQMLATTFHRNPDFAFALVRLIVQRMNRNNDRLSAENAKLRIDRQLATPRVF